MNKGFTLIELLIVMVLVGVLVTIALPKYYVSMERGRVMEGVNNLRAASQAVNASYIMHGNEYSKKNLTEDGTESGLLKGDFTKAVYFSTPVFGTTVNANVAEITTQRQNGENYTLTAHNEDGELKYIACAGDNELCQNIGFDDLSGGQYRMDFTK